MSGELGSTDFEKNGAPSRNRGGSQGPLAITWSPVEFAPDSPLEGTGFEPSVPRRVRRRYKPGSASRRWPVQRRGRRRGQTRESWI